MGKLVRGNGFTHLCTCCVCGTNFYEKKYRKDISKYCSIQCSSSTKVNNLLGKKYGRLQVISYKGIKGRYAHWECKCDCGKTVIVRGSHLLEGTTKSCGCYFKEIMSEKIREISVKHDLSKTRLYKVYTSMKARCFSKNNSEFKRYGGRGITMCEEWKNDFMAFYEWSIENGYNENADFMECTIDRVDNDGNYCPENCRWVSMKEQSLNKMNNRRVTYKGKSLTVKEISVLKNCSYGAIMWRLNNGWEIEDIFEIPVDNVHFNPRNNKKKISCVP